MPLTPEGWTLHKTWEGCRLSAYPDPASGGAPWTIRYAHTGAEVAPGDVVYELNKGKRRPGFQSMPTVFSTGVMFSLDTSDPVDLANTWIAPAKLLCTKI